MERRENARLRAHRESTPSRRLPGRSMPRAELAELVNLHVWEHHGIETPLDRKYLAKLESGRIRWPNARYREALREILGVTGDDELGFVNPEAVRASRPLERPVVATGGWDHAAGVVRADSGLVLPWTGAGAVEAVVEVAEDGEMERRTFMAIGGAALGEVALEWLIARPAADVERLGRRRLLDAQVDVLDEITAGLRRMDDRFGGGAVLGQAQAQVRHVETMLHECQYTESVGRHLLASAAELLRLTGWLARDAEHHALAQRYWIAALHSAHAAGDRQVGANVLGFMSQQAKDLGQVREAVQLAEAAAHRSHRSPRLTAILHLRVAQAHAVAGDPRECQVAVDAAGDALRSTGAAHVDPPWAYWLDESQWHEMAGSSWMRLGEWAKAEEHLTASLGDGSARRELALKKASLARVHACRGEPEQAMAVGCESVDLLATEVDSRRCLAHVREVRDALAPFGDLPAVREFSERVALLGA